SGETYWSEQQFEQLRTAESANLSSRGRIPWRLLAYLLGKNPEVQPIRDLVGRRLLQPKGIEEAQRDLNRMLITLWSAGYIELDPKPRAAQPKQKPKPADGDAQQVAAPKTEGLFGELLDQIRPVSSETSESGEENQDPDLIESRGYEVDDYRPQTANPTERLERLVHLRSINPLFGVYLADQLAIADPQERIAALESVLQVPGTVARFARVPPLDEMPPGTLAQTRLDPQLLQLGLATAEELGAAAEEDDEEITDRGFGRVMFAEPKVWPLTIGEKILRLFRNEYPRVHDVKIQ
ncbi:MAG: helicase, partial [Planctomycetaceae bacterium]|nr:helicase [Planctomycetaceae bacterium]